MDTAGRSIVARFPLESALVAVVIGLVIYLLKQHLYRKRQYRFPPGPKGLPCLGIFHEIYDYPAHLAYTAYAKDHGAMFTANVMGTKTVILNDVESVRTAMLKLSPIFDDRSSWRSCFVALLKGLSVMPYSKKYINTRRRTMAILRDYGMGRSFLEPRINEEARALLTNILKDCDNGKANIFMKHRVRRAPLNVICNMLFSERYEYDDQHLLFILDTMEYLLTFLRTACTYDSLPNILKPFMKYRLRDFHSKICILNDFLTDKVRYHENTYQDGVTRDFIDAWIKSQKTSYLKNTQDADFANNNFVEKDLKNISPAEALAFDQTSYSPVTNVLQDVLFAGAHSTGHALNWLVMFLTIRKDVQDRVHKAIVDVIGPSAAATMNDKPKLPIVEAVILETIRVSSLVPLVGHACYSDVTLLGYRLPEKTEVTYNNWCINHCEENFPNAYSFLPERWLNADGSFNRQLTLKFFPFGVGKRACAGESLARMELFLFTVALIQHLEFLQPDNSVDDKFQPEIKHVQNLVLEPKLYKVRVKKRSSSDL